MKLIPDDRLKQNRGMQSSCANRLCRHRGAFTLVELVISILIIMVLSTGALGYQYYSARDVKYAEVQTTATRLAMLLLESWKGQSGSEDYDPEIELSQDLVINSSSFGPAAPEDSYGFSFMTAGSYEVVIDDVYYYVTLSYDDSFFNINPRMINVTVAWNRSYQQIGQDMTGDESSVMFSTYIVEIEGP